MNLKEFYKNHKVDIDKVFSFSAFAFFVYLFWRFFSSYLAPLIFGYIICIILYPITRFFRERCKIKRSIASILSIILFLFLISFVCTNIIIRIVYQAKLFALDLPLYVENIVNVMKQLRDKFYEYFKVMPLPMQNALNNMYDNFIKNAPVFLGSGVKSGSMEFAKSLPDFIMIVILGFISSFFLLNEKEEIETFLKRQMPISFRKKFTVIKIGVINAITGYIKAQAILMCIIASICITGLSIIKYPYALFLGIIISFIDALPVFGSGAIFWPWCAYCFFSGNYKRAICIIIINLTVLLTRQVIEPRILGKQIGIHPLATLLSIYIGLKIFGLFGFIIGPMILVTLKAMQDFDLLPKWK